MSLRATPITIKAANALVAQWHRHHKPTQGGLWAVAVALDGRVVGVAIVGRPMARMLQDGTTCEVTRVATDGTPHACSKLYGLVRSIAQKMGYQRILTYTLESEPGTSLFAAGWKDDGPAGGGSWSRPSRERTDKAPLERKRRWST